MLRSVIALAMLALACCGCAASRSEFPYVDVRVIAVDSLAYSPADSAYWARKAAEPNLSAQLQAMVAVADSAWLRFTAPRYGALGCEPDTAKPLSGGVGVAILRLKGQAAAWRPGCEASVACWDSVRRQTTPDTVWSGWAVPGARCSVRVGAGEYVADVTRSRCRAWRVVRVGQ